MFDEAEIEYQIIDLSQDAQAMEMVKGMGYVSAPVVIAGDSHWSGFRHDKVLNAISQYRMARVHEAA